jgi:hypothetical protein
MDISTLNVIWFIIISFICALLGAALFGVITAKNPCRWSYMGIGAVIGLSIGPYLFAVFVMINIENSMIVTEKGQDVELLV